MPENEFKNQKIKEDIQGEVKREEAKLALCILGMVENSDGNLNMDEVSKLANACYKEKEGN